VSLTTDLASGMPFEKGLQTCAVAASFARSLGLDRDGSDVVFHTALLRSIGDARRSMHVHADVSLVRHCGPAGVHAHPHADGPARESSLGVSGCSHCVPGPCERDEERVALRVDLDA